jgi:hypothetical protein
MLARLNRFAQGCPRSGLGEKIYQLLHEGIGCRSDRITGQGSTELFIGDLLGVRFIPHQAVQHIGQVDRIGY